VEIKADDAAWMILETKSGAIGTVEASKIATGTNDDLRFEIHGDKGALRFSLMDANWLEFYDNTLPEGVNGGSKGFTKIECVHCYAKPGGGFPGPKFSPGWIRGHVHCLYQFISAVYEGRQPSPSFEEGAYIQYVMEKAYESASTGKMIEL
jgi:predicted dehydrogenase